MEYMYCNKNIEIYANKTKANTTKITVTKDRVTIKIGNRDLSLLVKEEWKLIANAIAEKEIEVSHRGMFQIMPHGGHAVLTTERKNSSFTVSYYRNISKVVVTKLYLPVKIDESPYEKILDQFTEEYLQ